MRISIQKKGTFRPEVGKGEIVVEYNVPTPYQIEDATGDHIATKLWKTCVTNVTGLEDEEGNALTKDEILAHGPWLVIDETAIEILRRTRMTEVEKKE